MYLTSLICLSITFSIHSAAAQVDEQDNCGCCPGVPGIPGNNGLTGASGPVGPKGDIGIKGSDGLKGEKGDVGFPGKVGPVGLQGVPGEVGLPGATGEKGEKGKNGDDGSVGLPGATGEKGEKGEKNEVNKSAFFVAFESDPGRVPSEEPLKYDTIITNIGSHYNKGTGKFVCQYPGTYVFHFTTQKDDNQEFNGAATRLIKNGEVAAYAAASCSGRSSLSNTAVLNLVRNDEIWTQTGTWNNFYSNNWRQCTFSGFLLYPA